MNIADINTEARALVDATSTSYADPLLLIRVNTAMEEIAGLILGSDGRWDYDDTNRTDFPNGTTNLVASQQDYGIDTTYLKVIGVSVKTANGIWQKLLPFDPDDLNSSSTPLSFVPLVAFGPTMDRAEFLKTPGLPQFYDVQGQSLILYPAPDNGVSVTLASGLKFYAQRTAALFTSAEVTTGTKVPGFPSIFHSLVSYMAALPYAMSYKPDRVQFLMAEIARKKKDLVAFYSKRDKDERTIMTGRRIRYI